MTEKKRFRELGNKLYGSGFKSLNGKPFHVKYKCNDCGHAWNVTFDEDSSGWTTAHGNQLAALECVRCHSTHINSTGDSFGSW